MMEDAKYVVTPQGLQETHPESHFNPVLRGIANLFSYIFHPAFVPIFVMLFLLFAEPFLFVGATLQEKILTFGRAFINYTFFPIVSVLLLRALKLIGSIKLEDRKDRIIPFIVCNIWYFWIWYVWRGLPGVPHFIIVFALAIFLASSLGLLANIYVKISMHGIAMGTATAFLALLTINPSSPNITVYLALALLATGIVGTSRLILGAHSPKEYYMGLGVGLLSVAIANLVA